MKYIYRTTAASEAAISNAGLSFVAGSPACQGRSLRRRLLKLVTVEFKPTT